MELIKPYQLNNMMVYYDRVAKRDHGMNEVCFQVQGFVILLLIG